VTVALLLPPAAAPAGPTETLFEKADANVARYLAGVGEATEVPPARRGAVPRTGRAARPARKDRDHSVEEVRRRKL